MKPGFSTIMSAQFFSSLADNALFMVAVELFRRNLVPEWQSAALAPIFALFYVLLAPFVGAFADAFPKGRVMFLSNAIKVAGCAMMLFGSHPLLAYAVVGLGAAAYSPAKYGILTELLPPSMLVKANGWIEGLTILSIIFGFVLGGLLVSDTTYHLIVASGIGNYGAHHTSPVPAALAIVMFIYALAALFNIFIPHTNAVRMPMWSGSNLGVLGSLKVMVTDFSRSNRLLWKDKLGQISLASTTLFWGTSGNLRYILISWSALALGLSTTQSSSLLGVVAIGTAIGALAASVRVKLERATSVLPLGMTMGLAAVSMHWIGNIYAAIFVLVLVGIMGGYMVVPMNALLQHRGHTLMGAGRSIAVQNFNEQLCILLLGLLYVGATKLGVGSKTALTSFGLLLFSFTFLIILWHRHNLRRNARTIVQMRRLIRQDHHRQD